MAQLWIVAGPNGAGKSTLVERYNPAEPQSLPVVNPDNIHKLYPERGRVYAGREAILQQEAHLSGGTSFIIETTLSGQRELQLVKAARSKGYGINFVYVGLPDPSLSIARIAQRVAAGGHHVPSEDVKRRYPRSLTRLAEFIGVADRVYIFDNSGERSRLLLCRVKGRTRKVASQLPSWLKTAIPRAFQKIDRGMSM